MPAISEQTIHELEQFDSCTISNAIEHFGVRLRNEGYMNASVKCLYPQLGSRVGYAATGRVRTSSTPVNGPCYYHSMDWWEYLETIHHPRFVILKDADHTPGNGALVGEIHANIFAALGCRAIVTNGAVRDVPGIEKTGIQIFAGNVAISHAYAHIVSFGEPVEVAGLLVKPGELLHGDQHGVLSVPLSIASEIPKVAEGLLHSEQNLIDLCRSKGFSLKALGAEIQRISKTAKIPGCPPPSHAD